jgi:hypothetical protein
MIGQRRAVLQGPLRPWQLRHPEAGKKNPLQGYPELRSPCPAPPVVVNCALDQFDRARTHPPMAWPAAAPSCIQAGGWGRAYPRPYVVSMRDFLCARFDRGYRRPDEPGCFVLLDSGGQSWL